MRVRESVLCRGRERLKGAGDGWGRGGGQDDDKGGKKMRCGGARVENKERGGEHRQSGK